MYLMSKKNHKKMEEWRKLTKFPGWKVHLKFPLSLFKKIYNFDTYFIHKRKSVDCGDWSTIFLISEILN